MKNVIKTSVSVPILIYNEMVSLMADLSMNNKSKFISNAISNYVSQMKWRLSKGEIAGVLMLAYYHERSTMLKRLMEVQHDFIDIIKSSIHFHLTKDLCFEIVGVVGRVERVKELISEMSRIEGICKFQVAFISIDEILKGSD
mgnify:CR=1 FL=1